MPKKIIPEYKKILDENEWYELFCETYGGYEASILLLTLRELATLDDTAIFDLDVENNSITITSKNTMVNIWNHLYKNGHVVARARLLLVHKVVQYNYDVFL